MILLKQEVYERNITVYWSAISRVSNFLMASNIAIFITSKLVLKGCYFTLISVGCLIVVHVMSMLSIKNFLSLKYYSVALIAFYFILASVVHWLKYQNIDEI